ERARWVVLALAALAATFWLGARMGAPAGSEHAGRVDRVVVERPVGAPITVHPIGGGGGLTRDDLRGGVREERAERATEEGETAGGSGRRGLRRSGGRRGAGQRSRRTRS